MKKEALSKIKTLAQGLMSPEAGKPAGQDFSEHPWLNHVAVLTGVLAALAGFLTVRSTTFTNDAIYESNQAVLFQTEASDAWAEYQADSIKARIVEMQLLPSSIVSTQDKQALSKEDEELRARQPKSKQDAQIALEQRQVHLDKGLKRLGQKDLLGYAAMAAQLGIAIASIAAITRKRNVFYAAVLVGALSAALTAYTLIGSYLLDR